MVKQRLLTLGIVMSAGVIRLPSLTQPLGPDQGIMAVIGDGILKGKLPYRDFWEMASPAIFYTYAGMFRLFGRSMAAIPITDILVSMLTTWLIFLVVTSLWDRSSGWASAVLFAVISNGARLGMHSGGDVAFGTFWYTAQRETFMLPLLTASILLAIQSERIGGSWWRLLLCGLCGGLAFLYKFPSILVFAAVIIYVNSALLTAPDWRTARTLVFKNSVMLIGFLAALIPPAVFFAVKGALGEMSDIIFGYVSSVYGQTRHDLLTLLKLGLSHTIFLAGEQFVLWLLAAASAIYLVCNSRRREDWLAIFWALGAVIYVTSHMEFLGYHYLMILPPFCALAGYGLGKIFGQQKYSWRNAAGRPAATIVAFAVLANGFVYATLVHAHYTKFYFYLSGKLSREQYYDLFTAYPKHDYSFAADYQVCRYIEAHTAPGDKVYSLGGIESVIYFLTRRESPSRFVFSWFLFAYEHSRVPRSEGYRKELLSDLTKDMPAIIVTVRPLEWFRSYQDIFTFIGEHYRLAETFKDDRYIYARQ